MKWAKRPAPDRARSSAPPCPCPEMDTPPQAGAGTLTRPRSIPRPKSARDHPSRRSIVNIRNPWMRPRRLGLVEEEVLAQEEEGM
jgi:hypothetical protein